MLNACNTSAAINIDSAQVKFEVMLLNEFTREEISVLNTLALKLFKIMDGRYNLPT